MSNSRNGTVNPPEYFHSSSIPKEKAGCLKRYQTEYDRHCTNCGEIVVNQVIETTPHCRINNCEVEFRNLGRYSTVVYPSACWTRCLYCDNFIATHHHWCATCGRRNENFVSDHRAKLLKAQEQRFRGNLIGKVNPKLRLHGLFLHYSPDGEFSVKKVPNRTRSGSTSSSRSSGTAPSSLDLNSVAGTPTPVNTSTPVEELNPGSRPLAVVEDGTNATLSDDELIAAVEASGMDIKVVTEHLPCPRRPEDAFKTPTQGVDDGCSTSLLTIKQEAVSDNDSLAGSSGSSGRRVRRHSGASDVSGNDEDDTPLNKRKKGSKKDLSAQGNPPAARDLRNRRKRASYEEDSTDIITIDESGSEAKDK